MVIEKGTQLFTAKVNDAAIEQGETIITYDGDIGEDAVLPGMTLFNKSLDDIGNEKGSARIKSINTGTKQIIVEPNSIDWKDNEDLLADGVFRLYRILPEIISGVVKEDKDKTYTNQNDKDKQKPVALMGCDRYAWTGEPISFYGWGSYAKARDASGQRYGIASYQWDFDGGTIVQGNATMPGTESSPIKVQWNTPGERHVSLLVTDDNGNTHKAYRPTIVVDRPGQGDSPPYQEFEVENLEGDWESGDWRGSIRVMGDASPSGFPNNARMILWSEDWYGDAKQSIGGWYGQEDILLCAYVIEDSVRQDAETGDVTFEFASITNQLKELDVWPLNFKNVDGSPGAWHEFKDMTIEDIFWHIVEEHTTLKNVADVFIWTGVSGGKRIDFVDITEAAVYDQLDQQLLSAIFGHLVSSRYSSVHGNRNFNMLNMEQRIQVGRVMMNLEKQDWLDDLEIAGERHRDAVCQVDFIGFIYNEDGDPIEVYSLAPENQKNFGRVEKQTGILLSGSSIEEAQPEANELSGLYLAYQNIRFPSLTAKLGNYRIFDPAHQDLVGLTLQSADTPRGYDWYDPETGKAKEFIVRRVAYEIDHEAGYMTAVLGLEASTWGKDGTSGDYPPIPPPPEPPEPPPVPPPPPPEPWKKKVYAATKGWGIYYTEDFSAPGGGDPTWWTVNDGLGALTTYDIQPDPWVPAYRQYCRTLEPKIYRREGGGAWTVILDSTSVASVTGKTVSGLEMIGPDANINAQGHVYVVVRFHDGTNNCLYFFKSADHGDTWSAFLISSHATLGLSPRVLRVGAFKGSSPYPAGNVIYVVYVYNLFSDWGMRVSVTQGATWGDTIDLGHCLPSGQGGDLAINWADQDTIYWIGWGAGIVGYDYNLRKSVNRGGDWVTLWPCESHPCVVQAPNIYIWNPLSAFMAAGAQGLHWTDDDWATHVTHTNDDNFSVDGCSRVMDAPEALYGYQSDNPLPEEMQHVIAVSEERGDHWEGKAGANCATPPYTGSIPKDCGGVARILEIWTE
jgi:hypothetical protein